MLNAAAFIRITIVNKETQMQRETRTASPSAARAHVDGARSEDHGRHRHHGEGCTLQDRPCRQEH